MIVSATKFARDCKSILDRVVNCGESVEIQRYGKTVAIMHPSVGATRAEILGILRGRGFSNAESKELRLAMDAASEIVGFAGRE